MQSQQQHHGTIGVGQSEVVARGSLAVGGDAPVVLDASDEPLDPVAVLVAVVVQVAIDFSPVVRLFQSGFAASASSPSIEAINA